MKAMLKIIDKKLWFLIFFSSLMIAIQGLCVVLQAQFTGDLISSLEDFDKSIQDPMNQIVSNPNSMLYGAKIWQVILIIFSILVVTVTTGITGMFTSSSAASQYVAILRRKSFIKIQKFSYQDIDYFSTSSLVTRLTNDTQLIFTGVFFILTFLVRGLARLIFGLVISITVSPMLSWIYLILVPLIAIFIFIIIKKSLPYFMKTQINTDIVNKASRDAILGVRILKSYNMEESQKTNFFQKISALMTSSTKSFIYTGIMQPTIQLFMNLGMVSILILAGVLTFNGSNTQLIQSIFGFVNVLQNVMLGLMFVLMSMFQIISIIPGLKRHSEILNLKDSIVFPQDSENKIEKGLIKFENVSYSYTNDENKVLSNITFTIQEKQKVGIIGQTGSGKSTLVNLICRLFDISSGKLSIDNKEIKEYSFHELNNNVSIAFQEVILFSGTIESNVSMGLKNRNIDNSEIINEALTVAQAIDFIKNKPDGIKSKVEQRGKNFSGGQKQRIAIARSIIKKPKIMIFDDSTSALDAETEFKVRKSLNEYNDSTSIFVSQKIDSVKDLDKILILNDGKLVGNGTHKELLANNTFYQNIAISQYGKEKVDSMIKEIS